MRHPNWRPALRDYVEDVARKPFRYGSHDCALFTAGAVKAMTGVDHARGWRSQYRSLAKGREMLAAVLDGDGGDALGVVQGAFVWAADPNGLRSVPLIQAKRAFRV